MLKWTECWKKCSWIKLRLEKGSTKKNLQTQEHTHRLFRCKHVYRLRSLIKNWKEWFVVRLYAVQPASQLNQTIYITRFEDSTHNKFTIIIIIWWMVLGKKKRKNRMCFESVKAPITIQLEAPHVYTEDISIERVRERESERANETSMDRWHGKSKTVK